MKQVLQNSNYSVDELGNVYSRGTKITGSKNNKGYIQVYIGGVAMLLSRIIWSAFHERHIPEGLYIDHINGDINDNRIQNLRVVTPEINALNRQKAKGCIKKGNSYCARIYSKNKKLAFCKNFKTEEEARNAYEIEKKKIMHILIAEMQEKYFSNVK